MRQKVASISLSDEQVETLKRFEPLLSKITAKYRDLPDYDDMRQQCRMNMCAGIRFYDESKGSLADYMGLCIRSALRKYWKVNFAVTKVGYQDEYGKNPGTLHLEELEEDGGQIADKSDPFQQIIESPDYIFSMAEDIIGNSRKSDKSKSLYMKYLQLVAAGITPSPTKLGERYSVSPQRAFEIIRDCNKELRKALS